ncbi:hypothetical protein ACOSQ3_003255 [Xanthoceras sorbifolium]
MNKGSSLKCGVLITSAAVWIIPPFGSYKLNVDASVLSIVGVVGLGAVFRNDAGLTMWTSCKQIQGHMSVLEAEAHALLYCFLSLFGSGI